MNSISHVPETGHNWLLRNPEIHFHQYIIIDKIIIIKFQTFILHLISQKKFLAIDRIRDGYWWSERWTTGCGTKTYPLGDQITCVLSRAFTLMRTYCILIDVWHARARDCTNTDRGECARILPLHAIAYFVAFFF